MNELWLIYGLIFGAAVLGVEALYWMAFRARGPQKSINRRLALSKKLESSSAVIDALRQERGFADFKNPMLGNFNDLIVQTGLRLGRNGLVLWTLLLSLALFALSTPLFGIRPMPFLGAILLAPLLVLMFLRITRAKRIARFAEQLPDAIDIIVRGVRVGHPFSVAIELVSRELPDPIGTEFGMTADETVFGQDVKTAISNLYRRVGQDDLLFLVIAINVQSQTGGNLAELLARLSRLIRQRARLKLKIKALTAEGRMSGWFLSAAPFILFGVITLLSPTYFFGVKDHPLAIPALIYCALSLIVGNVMIYRMVNFKF